MNDQIEKKVLGSWGFDDFGNGRGRVELIETEMGLDLDIYSGDKLCSFCSDRDQWGLWITFIMGDDKKSPTHKEFPEYYSLDGFTIGQEDENLSFLDALILGLTKLKENTYKVTIPEFEENS